MNLISRGAGITGQSVCSFKSYEVFGPTLQVHVSIDSASSWQYEMMMNVTLLKAFVLFVPAGLLLWHSLVMRNRRIPWSALQLIGAVFLVIVVLAHVCEALRLFPWMDWGAERSPGHYLDLSSAVLGLTLLPTAYVIRFITRVASNKSSKL